MFLADLNLVNEFSNSIMNGTKDGSSAKLVLLVCFFDDLTEKNHCQLSVLDRSKLMRYFLFGNNEKAPRKKRKHVSNERKEQALW